MGNLQPLPAERRVLVLGGTRFLGRALVADALARGWSVTGFNRGRTAADVPGAHVVRGDRTNAADLECLAECGPWDAVVDVHGVIPAEARDAARHLASLAGRYVFISTVSAYRDWPQLPVDESAPLHRADPDDASPWDWGSGVYGPHKAGAEAAVAREAGRERTLIVRPGVILGPWEYSGRLAYWLRRAARGGTMAAPAPARQMIQPVDVRDVAGFIWGLVDAGAAGAFNAVAPPGHATFADLVGACIAATGSAAATAWIDADRLRAFGVREWTGLPLWRTAPGTWQVNGMKAASAGLVCRPLAATVADTWVWMSAGGEPTPDARAALHGLAPDVEQVLLGSR